MDVYDVGVCDAAYTGRVEGQLPPRVAGVPGECDPDVRPDGQMAGD